MRRRLSPWVAAVCLATGIATAQVAAPPHPKAAPSRSASTPARKATSQPHLSDAQIDATIRVKLAKSKIGADHFKFHVQNGVVTIEGKTNVIQHKGAATRMARTSGALAVVNHIQISEAAREKARANLQNARRRAEIKRGGGQPPPAKVPSKPGGYK